MGERARHTEGFTLAELLPSVAIILVLAAIAVPSIIAVQSNLRMLELNNAAEQIANAAQAQMTAQKVSGTWWSSIQKGGTGSDAEDCTYPEATAASGDGSRTLYYMTASEARDAGIVSSLSIDEDVHNGEYVIEFDAKTASVARVFYADGKPGFFGGADAIAAQRVYTYYAEGAGSTNPNTRRAYDPMIGLFAGTPAGATSAIALKNPVISVDEKTGRLLVRDPNLDELTGTGDTQTSLIFTKTEVAEGEQPAVFRIAGLSNGTGFVTVSLVDASDDEGQGVYKTQVSLKAEDLLKQVNQVTPDGTGNVFSIDLNALVRAVEDAKELSGSAEIAAELERFAPGDAVEVKASTALISNTNGCIPATATAFIEWPAPVGKLTLMITNPYSQEVEDKEVAGAEKSYLQAGDYTAPTVEASTESQIFTAKANPLAVDFAMKSTAANTELAKHNKQAGWQSYVGGWVSSVQAAGDNTLSLRVTAGSYQAEEEQGHQRHQYQVWELWVQRSNGEYTRAGYMRNNVWEWAKGFADLEKCLTWYDAQGGEHASITGANVAELGIVSVSVSGGPDSFGTLEGLGLLDADRNASIYVRTAPNAAEVQAFFNDYVRSGGLKADMGDNRHRTGSRGYGYGLGLPIREKFEVEFGVSSSDVSWVVSQGENGGLGNEVDRFLKSSMRIYYSVAPGLAFDNIRANQGLLSLGSTEMTNTMLWLYRDVDGDEVLDAHPTAFVQSGMGDKKYFCRGTEAADFELHDELDWLFYRLIEYADDAGAPLAGYDMQYVPYAVQDDDRYAKVQPGTNKSDEDVFVGWTSDTTRDGQPIDVGVGTLVGSYDGALNYGYTRLQANYVKVGIGLVYFEQYADENRTIGYYGYLSEKSDSFTNTLKDDARIESWGYRLIVPDDGKTTVPSVTDIGASYYEKQLIKAENIYVGSSQYRAFSFDANDSMKKNTKTLTYSYNGVTAQYSFNLNFACAVAQGNGRVKNAQTDGVFAWSVRHASQFPGSLKWTGSNDSIQNSYASDIFKQERSIDFAQRPSGDYKFTFVFSGTYDGGSFAIENFYLGFIANNGEGYVINPGQGLFPKISGATIKNVKLMVRGAQSIPASKAKQVFGCLVGVSENSFIYDCLVVGQKSANGTSPSLTVTNVLGSSEAFGGLVGSATGTSIYGSSVSDLAFVFETKSANWDAVSVGGVFGTAMVSSIYGCKATDISMSLSTQTTTRSSVKFGGMIGDATNSSVQKYPEKGLKSEATNVQWLMPEAPAEQKVVAGTMIGNWVGSAADASCTASNVTYQIGKDSAVEVTDLLGKAKP